MKKRIIFLFSIMLSIGILEACGSDENQNDKKEGQVPQMLEVKVKTDPGELSAGKTNQVSAIVTQGEEKVSDADEVLFEIWKEGVSEEDHIKKEAELKEDGIYAIDYTFDEKGKYFIIAHVTARDLHNMPKVEVNVQ
ncbi:MULTISPECIES: FixH family protein [Bacillaceae]|jgi:YtkA-like|uniref:FixH family protein n=1 Tax=Bacillaceae TaxID=186817 RepID=UPI0018DC5CBB|nr:FixH family protein [[Bacillus] enclensis]MBH9965636.1 FixH family protein [[Bacillus] enclensis]MBW3111166.1 FixH family protein [Bacillus sp. MCCB 382]